MSNGLRIYCGLPVDIREIILNYLDQYLYETLHKRNQDDCIESMDLVTSGLQAYAGCNSAIISALDDYSKICAHDVLIAYNVQLMREKLNSLRFLDVDGVRTLEIDLDNIDSDWEKLRLDLVEIANTRAKRKWRKWKDARLKARDGHAWSQTDEAGLPHGPW
jgi:hypothetical protein